MDKIVKINAQTAGRDKIARLFQYLTRAVWHRLQLNNKDGVDGLKNLEFQLSSFRKLLRFGKCIDTLYSTLSLFQHENQTVKLTVIVSRISTALFLLADHMLWLGRTDLFTINTSKWSKLCSKYWLMSLTFNLLRDFYEIISILTAQKSKIVPASGVNTVSDVISLSTKAFVCVQQNKNVMYDFVKNFCDFWIPLSALGHVNLSPGTIGILGTVSSLIGLIVLFDPTVKLSP